MNIRIIYGLEKDKSKNYNLFGYTYIPLNKENQNKDKNPKK